MAQPEITPRQPRPMIRRQGTSDAEILALISAATTLVAEDKSASLTDAAKVFLLSRLKAATLDSEDSGQ